MLSSYSKILKNQFNIDILKVIETHRFVVYLGTILDSDEFSESVYFSKKNSSLSSYSKSLKKPN